VAGWVKGLNTPSAKLARSWLGPVHWDQPLGIVYPAAVLTLFASDIGLLADASKDSWQRAPVQTAAYHQLDINLDKFCSSFMNAITGAINDFFAAIGHVQPDQEFIDKNFGGAVHTIISVGAAVFSFLGNLAIDSLKEIVLD